MVGGGGGGGCSSSVPYNSGNPSTAGGGGGSGGYIECVLTGLNSTYTTLSLSVGSGGAAVSAGNVGNAGTATTVTAGSGATALSLSAGGGGGGSQGTTSQDTGGAPGTNTVTIPSTVQSYYQVSGSSGGNGQFQNPGGSSMGGNGGPSYFGGGGKGGFYSLTTSGTAYGSGGGGCGAPPASAGAGAPGVVIITYFTQSGLPTNYTATAPLSMSGTTLSIAAATTSAAGVVQVGSGLSVSSGVISAAIAFLQFRCYNNPTNLASPDATNRYTFGTGSSVTMYKNYANVNGNITSPFNTANGRFACPVSGSYFITAWTAGHTVSPIGSVYLFRGTAIQQRIQFNSPNCFISTSLYAQQNDIIIITLDSGDVTTGSSDMANFSISLIANF